jgi:hypothetical protein
MGEASRPSTVGRVTPATGAPQNAAMPAGGRGAGYGPSAEIKRAQSRHQAGEGKNMLAGRATRC